MAKERVQVQGLGDAVPGIQPTIQRGGQYAVQVQRAGRNKLMDLADALGQVNPLLQEYGKIQKFQYEKGVERGEMEAATADLDTAFENLDKSGEKLVEAGLMPRSQLVGYQRSFRRRIGQRQAKTTYASSLEARMEEVTQNLDSDEDIIESILTEERQKMAGQLGSSQFAMQGFMDYAEDIESRFATTATKRRDKATQDFNESLVIEDLNRDYADVLIAVDNPKDRALLQNDIKTTLDSISEDSRIPRSRVVELFWGGFAKPNIDSLLVGDNPQPDKAENMLNSMLDIDLTGKGGKLGNINREGAQIRTNSIAMRNSIQKAREKIEKDEDENYRDITNLAGPALTTVLGGLTGNDALDAVRAETVKRLLDDTGGDFEKDTGVIAAELIQTKDADKLLQYMSFYNADESKRKAYGRAILPLNDMAIKIKTRSTAILSKEDLRDVESNLKDYVNAGGEDPKGFLSSGANISDVPVIAPEAVAMAEQMEINVKANTWFERSELYPDREDEFEGGFESVLEELEPNMKDKDISNIIEREAAPFKERYNQLIKQQQLKLKNDPNRDERMIRAFESIKEEVIGNWRSIKQAEKNYQEELRDVKEGTFELSQSLEDLGTLEDAQDVIEDKIGTAWKNFFDMGPDDPTQKIVFDVDLEQLGDIDPQSRAKAWDKAEVVRGAIDKADVGTDTSKLQDVELLIRRKWGFKSPQEALELEEARDETVLDIDYRETPYFEDADSLIEQYASIRKEWLSYSSTPKAERNLDEFPVFSTWNKVFGVLSKEDIVAVAEAQGGLFKSIK